MGPFSEMVKWAYLIKIVMFYYFSRLTRYPLVIILNLGGFFNKNSTLIIGARWRGGFVQMGHWRPIWGFNYES
jgi:hypothetical protein